MVVPYDVLAVKDRLRLDGDWPRRWTASLRFNGDQVVRPVRDLASAPVLASGPTRQFTWRAEQRHRPGLWFMMSTGRLHGCESLEEQSLLLALDFLRVLEVLSQPFCLEFEHVAGRSRHTPDYLVLCRMPEAARSRPVQDSVDADRRRRREAAVALRRPTPPPRLGTSLRRNLFLLPSDDSEPPGESK
ncbi:hypothetical protein ACWEWG_11370 [Streptomyces sp. NPDC003758]